VKQVLVQGGGVVVQDVPAPGVSARNIRVRVEHSCVSAGTEMAGVQMSGLPIYKRALKQPENVKRVLDMVRDQGLARTLNRVQGKLSSGTPTGYSAAGIVLDVGAEVEGFRAGDRVACAGAGIANHAEIIDVPVNLAVSIPEGLGTDWASTVTLGSIAMQGVRRAGAALGENVAVIGLGILGQLTVQMLKANGARVLGSDVDPSRIATALAAGMDVGINPAQENFVERVQFLTDGFGADIVLVTAATASNEVIKQAFNAARRKGRVVLVGDVGLNINRADIYAKELDFLVSTSYGPGRYDATYEEGGQDYPYAYVRWTENRNMESYLRLLQSGALSLEGLKTKRFPIDQATAAYEALKGEDKPMLVLLEYPERPAALERKVMLRHEPAAPKSAGDKVRVGVVGAGSFAQGVHLPNLVKLRERFEVRAVMNRTGSNGRAVATQYEAAYATTEFEEILRDADIDLVLISTRHDLHGPMTLQALQAGKHVFVEKPLTLTQEELDAIAAFYDGIPAGQKAPVVLTGFNRRFSPALEAAREILQSRSTPMIVNYRMNAGYIPPDHWVHGPEGGGRNLGEACHIYDLFNALTNARVRSVEATAIRPTGKQWFKNDNFVATIGYEDGSVCTLTYTALGAKSHPKEQMEVFCDGKVVVMDDYKSLTVEGSQHKGWNSQSIQKGHFEELQSLSGCLHEGKEWPIPLWQQIQATEIALRVEAALREQSSGAPSESTSDGVVDSIVNGSAAVPSASEA
jgi:predicted dehydrogenase/threonine dehydrogenase-like Zn-dependent dehydrogenase